MFPCTRKMKPKDLYDVLEKQGICREDYATFSIEQRMTISRIIYDTHDFPLYIVAFFLFVMCLANLIPTLIGVPSELKGYVLFNVIALGFTFLLVSIDYSHKNDMRSYIFMISYCNTPRRKQPPMEIKDNEKVINGYNIHQ